MKFLSLILPKWLVICIVISLFISLLDILLDFLFNTSLDSRFKLKYPNLYHFYLLYPDTDYTNQILSFVGDMICIFCPILNCVLLLCIMYGWKNTINESIEKRKNKIEAHYKLIRKNIINTTQKDTLPDEVGFIIPW